MADEMAGAGITAKERLERIEDLLVRMDSKIDMKFDSLEGRIRHLEDESNRQSNIGTELEELKNGQSFLLRKVWTATGVIAAVVFIVNLVILLYTHGTIHP